MKRDPNTIHGGTVLYRCDRTGEVIYVGDVLTEKITIERVADVIHRMGVEPERVLQNLVSLAMQQGWLPAMKAYADTGNPVLLGMAIRERELLDLTVAEIKADHAELCRGDDAEA